MSRKKTVKGKAAASSPSAGSPTGKWAGRTARSSPAMVPLNGVVHPSGPAVSSSSEFYDIAFKVMLVGDSGVGKTCLLVRFKDAAFLAGSFISTVGIDFRNKVLTIDGVKVKLQIWDTAGQERFRSVTHAYYRDAHALLLLYDVTNKASFDNIQSPRAGGAHRSDTESFSSSLRRGLIQEPGMDAGSKVISTGSLTDTIKLQTWLTEIHDYAQQDVVLMLLGNKADAAQERVVKREDGERLAKEFGVPFMETSARSGLNIDLAFTAVAKELKHRSLKDPSETFKLQEYVDKEMKSSGCCRA